ncbi:MAG: translation initiation factor IF-2 [Bacteroides sp.]|nr:translation initiation factor IF-2 [Bacteroides sp.]MCM1413062.1 translation initiation factor IF-2 [Bacteroides sp.]MCM1471768.1 translation initiation factor IF-2 [Bacteroides sp.]
MARTKISKAAKDFNISIATVVDFLQQKGITIDNNPNSRIDDEAYELLVKEYNPDRELKNKSDQVSTERKNKETVEAARPAEPAPVQEPKRQPVGPKVIGKIDLNTPGRPVAAPAEPEVKPEPKKVETPVETAPQPAPVVVEEKKAETPAPVVEKAPEKKPETQVAESAPAPEAPKAEEKKEEAPAQQPVAEAKPASEAPADDFVPTRVAGPGLSINVVGKIDLSALNQSTRPKKKTKEEKRNERNANARNASPQGQNGNAATAETGDRKKRKRIRGKEKVDITNPNHGQPRQGQNGQANAGGNNRNQNQNHNRRQFHSEVNEEDVQKQVKETLARLTSKDKGLKKGAKWRKEKREATREREREAHEMEAAESKVLKLTEFVTANDLASMMNVPINNVIGTCMSIGVMVSINQRLDAETINIVAEEFGFKTEYVSAEVVEAIAQEEDSEEDLQDRPPIVTVMGHVDHGKTSLLDYIRNANVIAGEAGGITQHIGAYNVKLADGRHITFLDTPGHEAFTAMRARGAKVTDICIIIVAADDNVMPQTVEAINHASAAGVPIVFAINKIDKPAANPDKIKEELANMNYLIEEWGGKYQSQDISAKKGTGVDELMEKVLLEAEMLELKANPNRNATGSIIESSLDKGRGYVATVLVQNGTLRVGDIILAGTHYGKVKAMFNERNQRIKEAGPATPALILGLNGAPTAGDTFNVMDSEQEAKEITNKREQLQRELGLRTKKILTLEDIGRRRAIGNFQELNIIVKGDVDGSIEALSDSLIKLSTEEIQINVLHKAVGEISESDVTLAAASDAIIIGFQVRPSLAARRAAERDGVEIRLYSVIYQAIEEVKDAMEGMLAPELKEEITGTAEVLQTYKISKVGTVAGCIVREGKIKRSCKIRLIRDGIVRYTGELDSLKRFKDDVKEVVSGYDCGLNIKGYNDVREGDIIEGFEEVEVKKSL